jgi:membrane associated rhomboid family serine protease
VSNLGGLNCPYCRYYNARDDRVCGRCKRHLPPAALSPLIAGLGGVDLWATKALAATSIIVFAFSLKAAGPLAARAIAGGLPIDVLLRFGALTNGLEWAEPWRLVAACFVHISLLHIVMNLFAFAELGRAGEKLVGGTRFVVAYVVTGVAGYVASTFWYGDAPYITAGASGAIFGLDGMLLSDRMVKRDPVWKDMLVRTLVHSFLFYYALRTNQAAHLGGLAAGLLLGSFYALEKRPWKRDTLFGVLAALSVPLIAASLVLPHLGPDIRREPRLKASPGPARRGAPAHRVEPARDAAPSDEGDEGDERE